MSTANNLQFDTETVTVSRYGAKLRVGPSNRTLVCGDHIRVSQRGSYTWRTARVSWVDRIGGGFCGIELQDPENFWGVYFPEKTGEAAQGEEGAAYTPLAIRVSVVN